MSEDLYRCKSCGAEYRGDMKGLKCEECGEELQKVGVEEQEEKELSLDELKEMYPDFYEEMLKDFSWKESKLDYSRRELLRHNLLGHHEEILKKRETKVEKKAPLLIKKEEKIETRGRKSDVKHLWEGDLGYETTIQIHSNVRDALNSRRNRSDIPTAEAWVIKAMKLVDKLKVSKSAEDHHLVIEELKRLAKKSIGS